MPLKVTVSEREKSIQVITIEGSLDSDTYLSFEEKVKPLLVTSTKALVLDMANLDYISSAGLAVIFQAKRNIESNQGSFIMTNLKPQIRKVFEIVKALPVDSIFENMEEVDKYLDEMQKKEVEKQGGAA